MTLTCRHFKIRLASGLMACLVASMTMSQAQDGPDVEAPLVADAANDYFERGKNLHDEAQRTQDAVLRKRLHLRSIEILESWLNDFPQHENAPKAFWLLGVCYKEVGQPKDADRCYRVLLQRFQEGPWVAAAAYAVAAEHYNKKEYAVAAPLFEKYAALADRQGEAARGNYYAGHCYRLGGINAQAMTALQKVVDDPQGGEFILLAKLGMGHVAGSLGRNQDAFDHFVEVTEAADSDAVKAEALLNAALAARALDKLEISTHYLERILRTEAMKAWWPSAHSALMTSHFEAGDYEKVIAMHTDDKAVQLQGQQEAARLLMVGRAHMRLKDSEKALGLFRTVERMVTPESDLAFEASFYRLMCFYRIEGKHVPEQVDAFLELYEAKRPDDLRIHTALMMKAESLFSEGKVAAAAQVYNRVDADKVSDANRPGLLYQRGWCLAEAGDLGGAIRSLDAFIGKYKDDERIPSALAKRAKVHDQAGQPERAIVDYDQLVKLGNPAEMVIFGWLESARLRRQANQIEDMISRYQGLLNAGLKLEPKLEAEANYWIGWGLVKTNQPKLSIEPLEKARKLRGDLYGKHAGLLLALGYFAAQNIEMLAQEVHLAIKQGYQDDLPDQTIQWIGMQSYNAGAFEDAATFLALIANPDEPRETPKEVWRYLGKSRIETGKAELALPPIGHMLDVEQNAAWRADGLLDRGRALAMLEKVADARQAVDQAFGLQPQGRTRGSLRILAGDLDMKEGNPDKASAQYLTVVNFINDKQLKPLALHKLIAAQVAIGNPQEADKYRQQLQTEFPEWKAP